MAPECFAWCQAWYDQAVDLTTRIREEYMYTLLAAAAAARKICQRFARRNNGPRNSPCAIGGSCVRGQRGSMQETEGATS